jgi:hypothetical protein
MNPRTRRRAASSKKISQENIQDVVSSLQNLPAREMDVPSLREAVALLQDPINTALDRGYSYEEVTEVLQNQGIKVSVSSLKRYLSITRNEDTSQREKRISRTNPRQKDEEMESVEFDEFEDEDELEEDEFDEDELEEDFEEDDENHNKQLQTA